MRKRDWIGTALLAIALVLIVADLKTWLNWILVPVVAILALWLGWELWRGRRVEDIVAPGRFSEPGGLIISARGVTTHPGALTSVDPPIEVSSFRSTEQTTNLSNVYKDPRAKGRPDYSAIPVDYAKLQPTKEGGVPDFTSEWEERDRLLQRCAGSVEEPEAVAAWITGTYNKLRGWSHLKAMEFKPDQSSATEDLYMAKPYRLMENQMRSTTINFSRQNLTMYGERLAKILDDARKEQR